MKQTINLKCWFFGHDTFNLFSKTAERFECLRCKKNFYYNEITETGFLGKVQNYFLTKWRIIEYFKNRIQNRKWNSKKLKDPEL